MIVGTVLVAGRPIDPCMVLHEVQVEHGRAGFGADPEPSRATVTIRGPLLPSWAAGDILQLSGPHGPVFAGRITDRALTHPEAGVCDVAVTATGALAQLGRRQVGDEPWPVEAAQDRAARILTLAEPPGGWLVQAPGVEGAVVGRDVDARTPLELLTDLTATTGGALYDTPSGRVVYQPLPSRQQPRFPFRWRDFPPGRRWRDVPQRWDGLGDSPQSRPTLTVPPCLVEWEPRWSSSVGTVVNAARVAYGPPVQEGDRPVVEVVDDRSVDAHGRREARIDSEWLEQDDAAERASRIIATQARDRWEVDGAALILDEADPGFRDAAMALRVGDLVQLTGLPSPSPGSGSGWLGVVEGWTLQQWTDAGGQVARLALRLSDPLLSLLVARWRDAPPQLQWSGTGSRRWRDLETWEAA